MIHYICMNLRFDREYYLNLKMQPLAGTSMVNWVKLLLENKFCIDWRFIPRTIYVTLMIAVISPFRFYEKLKFEKKIREINIPPPLFIIGHFRSGTTFLHYLMGQDRNLAYVSTLETMAPWVFLGSEKIFKSMVEKRLPEKRPMDDLEMKAGLPYEEEYALANLTPYSFYHGWYFPRNIEYYFRRYVLFENVGEKIKEEWKKYYLYLLKKITYKHDGKRILMKSLVNTGRIKMLLEIFPDAKFIHIYRNPYKVYLSTWRLYEKILPIFSFHHIEREKLDEFIINFYREVYMKYIEEKKLIPEDNLVEISYENFVKEPLKTLKNVYEKIGMNGFEEAEPYFKKFIERYRNYKPYNYKIDEETKKKIYKEWKFAFDEFGYPP
ncbi:MAG TPA: sulfotransferase [Thermoplasmatales archaeon]|nr:sulfotransferase [Thermoplasmatales archaeon]